MATVDLVLLSSSPPANLTYGQRSSSSSLPSPGAVVKRKPRTGLQSGSRAACIPDGATVGFAFSSTLLKDGAGATPASATGNDNHAPNDNDTAPRLCQDGSIQHAHVDEDSRSAGARKGGSATVTKQPAAKSKRSAVANEAHHPELTTLHADYEGMNNMPTTRPVVDTPAVVEPKKRARKSRAKPDRQQTNTKRGRATVPLESTEPDPGKTSSKIKVVKKRKATGTASGHFTPTNASKEDLTTGKVELGLGLDEALKRRMDWTPPRDSVVTRVPEADRSSVSPSSKERQTPFTNLLDDYGHSGRRSCSPSKRSSGAPLTKRKQIELFASGGAKKPSLPTSNPSAGAKKAGSPPKKKARTITELATAQFSKPDDVPHIPDESSTTLRALAVADPNIPLVSGGAERSPKKLGGTKSRKKAAPKSAKATKDKKPAKKPPQILLSPDAAVARLANQDFVFGTSSQLALGQSPSSTRHVPQQVLDFKRVQVNTDGDAGHSLRRVRGALWNAAARDFENSLLTRETQEVDDLATCSELPPRRRISDFQDIDEIPEESRLTESDNWIILDTDLPQSTQGNAPKAKASVQHDEAADPTHEVFSTYTTSYELSKISPTRTSHREISPQRSRSFLPTVSQTITKASTALLHTASALKSVRADVSIPQEPKPKKARGRPRKADPPSTPKKKKSAKSTETQKPKSPSAARPKASKKKSTKTASAISQTTVKACEEWIDIDAIEDSEPEVTPSPPRRRRRPSKEPSLELASKAATAPDADWASMQDSVFRRITDAVKASGYSHDLAAPTWLEKILLYDPIVDEDLTAWLNQRGLRVAGKKGEEGEVQTWMVRKWCEDKSVCCVSGEGLRFGRRGRH